MESEKNTKRKSSSSKKVGGTEEFAYSAIKNLSKNIDIEVEKDIKKQEEVKSINQEDSAVPWFPNNDLTNISNNLDDLQNEFDNGDMTDQQAINKYMKIKDSFATYKRNQTDH